MSQPSPVFSEGARRLSRPSLATIQFGSRSSSVVRKSRIQSVLSSAAGAAQAEEADHQALRPSPTLPSQSPAMSDTVDDRASNSSDGSAADPKSSAAPGQRDSDTASVTENPIEAARIGAAKSAQKKPPGPPSKAPAPPTAKSDATTVQVTNALSSVPEGGGVSDWKKSSKSKPGTGAKKLPAVKPANAGKRGSSAGDKKLVPRASVVPRRGGGGGPANSPENMARSAAQKKRDREILKKRLKRRVFFMLWYGKAFTPAQVWGLRALMTLTVVSVLGVMLETMETSTEGNAFQTFAEPVSAENDPATVSYNRNTAVVNGLITLEIIVVVASLIEYTMRLWVCTISKRYVQQYDESSFWMRWGCCFRSCLYGEEMILMGAADEEAALKMLKDKKRSVQSPLLPGAAGAMSAAKTSSAGGGGGGGAAAPGKLTPSQIADHQALARKQGQSMDLKARIMRSRIPTKQELRTLRNKSRLMFALSFSSLVDVLTMMPVAIWALSGGAVDVFGVGAFNLLPAAMRIIRLLRLTKFARYMEGIRLLVAVAVEKRTEMATGFLLCIMVAIVMSGGVFLVETSANPEQFIDFFSAVYYSIITLSTVGYGDKFPITQTGRILGGLGALMGIGLFTLPSSIITSGFEEKSEREYTSRRDGLDMIDIVQRRWELRQAISWWRYAARMQVMAEEHMLRKSALEVLRDHRSNSMLNDGDFDMDENDSGVLDNLDANSEESKSTAVRGHRDSMATMGGGLGDSVSVLGGLRAPPSPRGKQRRGSMGFSVRSSALDAQSTLAISGIARTALSEEDQLEAIMAQLKPLRSQTEERRLAKALQLLDVCNGDVGEALMILSEVMSGAAAAAIQVGDSRVGGNSTLKLKK